MLEKHRPTIVTISLLLSACAFLSTFHGPAATAQATLLSSDEGRILDLFRETYPRAANRIIVLNKKREATELTPAESIEFTNLCIELNSFMRSQKTRPSAPSEARADRADIDKTILEQYFRTMRDISANTPDYTGILLKTANNCSDAGPPIAITTLQDGRVLLVRTTPTGDVEYFNGFSWRSVQGMPIPWHP